MHFRLTLTNYFSQKIATDRNSCNRKNDFITLMDTRLGYIFRNNQPLLQFIFTKFVEWMPAFVFLRRP